MAKQDLSAEEKQWCLEQAVAILKEVGHGGESDFKDAAAVLQNLYQTLYLLRQNIRD